MDIRNSIRVAKRTMEKAEEALGDRLHERKMARINRRIERLQAKRAADNALWWEGICLERDIPATHALSTRGSAGSTWS